jgi:beta-lactam-binding protein with PASTA domain
MSPFPKLRTFVFFCIALVFLCVTAAVAVFFFSVRGAEQTLVPDVRGEELTAALMQLQAKELYPRLQLQYSDTPQDKGKILDQDPPAGTIVKAGRRIRLVVSQGVVINTVGNYVGRNVGDVKLEIRTLFASADKPLLNLIEPYTYEYSSEAVGTILEQDPEAGTKLSGPTDLSLVVSKGPQYTQVATPNVTGLTPAEAVAKLNASGLGFSFTARPLRPDEKVGVVVYQDPPAGTTIDSNRRVTLFSPVPETPDGLVYGLFKFTLPESSYPLPLELDLQPAAGVKSVLVSCSFIGGEFSFPYAAVPGSTLVLTQLGKELTKELISTETADNNK